MRTRAATLSATLCSCAFTVTLLVACGDSGNSGFGNSDNGNGGDGGGGGDDATLGDDTSLLGDATRDSFIDPDAFWANDPPPQWCGPDGGPPPPPPPGGTPDCPDDKNREGCPCSPVGKTAACWPGLRANRNLGICKDGQTTCIQNNEQAAVWGPCVGYVLPDPNAKKGKAACKCFSGGQWKIDNLEPCFEFDSNNACIGAVSTWIDPQKKPQCPTQASNPPQPQPNTDWSTDALQVDCAGHYKLCYELKAGDAKNPQQTDCSIIKVCVEGDYTTANQLQNFPDLPAWATSTSAQVTCAQQFVNTGGYGEMSVIGLSVRCDKIDDGSGNPYVFNRVQYCPLSCNTNPNQPQCQNCGAGGSGNF